MCIPLKKIQKKIMGNLMIVIINYCLHDMSDIEIADFFFFFFKKNPSFAFAVAREIC